MGNHFSKPEWDAFPWRRWTHPSRQLNVLPTFVVCEWAFRLLNLACLRHAARTNQLGLWLSGWIAGTANDCFFMALPFCDNFWQAQASVMLTPRLPLYIVEMYACLMYVSTSAARRYAGLGPYAQAALAGLLAHCFYGVYDVNGPRFLWWTWHDGDPAIRKRRANAPYGSSLWILTYVALHKLLRDGALAPRLRPTTKYWARAGKRAWQLAGAGLLCTPLFMGLMGALQLASRDTLGVPGKRTYRLAVALMAGLVARGVHRAVRTAASAGRHVRVVRTAAVKAADATLLRWLCAYFAAMAGCLAFGDPRKHVSTGVHQRCGTGARARDVMGFAREDELDADAGGPVAASAGDYALAPADAAARRATANGAEAARLPTRAAANRGPARAWYSVYGKRSAAPGTERGVMAVLAAIGLASFSHSLAGEMRGVPTPL